MVIAGGDLPSETRSPYHKPDRPQQLFVDFRIDFINKMLIIGLIEREPEESAMSELGIYDGCYAQLRNGDVVGPIKDRGDAHAGARWATINPHRVWYDNGLWSANMKTHLDIVRVIDTLNTVKLTMSKTYGDFSKFGQAGIPPHVTKAAMDAGIKADPAYEQFVNAILTAGFKAQYGIGFVPVVEQSLIDIPRVDLVVALTEAERRFSQTTVKAQNRIELQAEEVQKVLARYGKAKNESEKRISDSEKTKGGLSAIPSVQTIDEAIRAAVQEWRQNNPVAVVPPTHYIAKKVYAAIATPSGEDVVHLISPEGWYLYECKHEHTSHRFAGQTVTPSDHPGGAWSVDFQRLANGGMLTGGRGKTLVEAWQNAVIAIKLAEEHGLDI